VIPFPQALINAMTFPCTQCGACCRQTTALKILGFETKRDGSCKYLTPENKCSIYERRPRVCRIQSNYPLNAENCNKFQIQLGIDEKFRVHLQDTPESLSLHRDTSSPQICSEALPAHSK